MLIQGSVMRRKEQFTCFYKFQEFYMKKSLVIFALALLISAFFAFICTA